MRDVIAQARDGVLAEVAPGHTGESAESEPAARAARPAAGLALRTSMRNQWPCVVEALEGDGAVVRVLLRGERLPPGPASLPAHGAASDAEGLRLSARITRESSELLGLRPGTAVLALCKATAVRAQTLPSRHSAPAAPGHEDTSNTWAGRVARVSRGGEQGDEIAAELDAGVRMVGFAPAGSGLRTGRRVVLSVEESAVVLAVVEMG